MISKELKTFLGYEEIKKETTEICKHEWIDYNSDELDRVGKEGTYKLDEHINNLLLKKINEPPDKLIDKMLELLITIRKTPKARGICMICGIDVEVMYLLSHNHAILY